MDEPLYSIHPNPIEQSRREGEEMELALKEKGKGKAEELDDPNYDPSTEADEMVTPVKRKRGRPPKAQKKQQQPVVKKKDEEEVCFLCFDGGNLVCCDRRGCPKVYHASCINRDEAFFQTKGKWNCGWHICSICERTAQYMCCTCTFSLCQGCIKVSSFVCVRGKKGFCENCFGTVKLIESKEHGSDEKVGINFDDKNSFECLFRDYWFDVKRRLSLTVEELRNSKVPLKGSVTNTYNKDSSSDESYNANEEEEASSDSSLGHREGRTSSRKKVRKRSRTTVAEESTAIRQVDNVETSIPEDSEWASKELLQFVAHMKGGDSSPLSQFDVQALLLVYIKENNLRDPRKKSYIICDQRLENLFGKARVGHFEMLKLIELHFPIKEPSNVVTDDNQGTGVDPISGQIDDEAYPNGATKGSDKRRKGRKKLEEREPQNNLDDFAAIDVHNINLIFLRRNLMEDLLDDVDTFTEKVVGSFVRIRISSTGQKQDMYRLAQVVGTSKLAERYKTGRKATDLVLDILNLNKKEVITIEGISNQDFTEEECKRLRQSIKCGLINRFTVGDLQEKAVVLHAVHVNDLLESEKQRLAHLRDRASETGRRKELRECVEKLQLLSTPEERARRLNEVPEIHSDPKMHPDYESSDEEEESDDKKQVVFSTPRGDLSLRKGIDLPPKGPIPARDFTRNARPEVALDTVTEKTNMDAPEAKPEALIVEDKIWNYKDPEGKIQGPFCLSQLRKWDATGFFPVDLRIWRASENEEDSVSLADALVGKFEKDLPQWKPPEMPPPTLANISNNTTVQVHSVPRPTAPPVYGHLYGPPPPPQYAGPVVHGYGPPPPNWNFQPPRNPWAPPPPVPQPTWGPRPMGPGWGPMNMIRAPPPIVHPMGNGWAPPFQPTGAAWGPNPSPIPTRFPSIAPIPAFPRNGAVPPPNPGFFESGCPSPTPEANKRLESSNPVDNMSPIRDMEVKPLNLEGTGGEAWSLPSPTPPQNNPWVSPDVPSGGGGGGGGLPPQDAKKTANQNGGWGTWKQGPVKVEDGQENANGWGTPSGKDQNNPWVSTDPPSSGGGLAPQKGKGWGTWQGVASKTAKVEDGKDTNGWGAPPNRSVDRCDRDRGGHGRDSRYDSRRERDYDSRRERDYDSRRERDYDSRYGGRSQRNDRGGRSSKMGPGGEGEGQGFCKFYEGGYCKKGASCNYLHS